MTYCLLCSLLLLSTTGVSPVAAATDQSGRLVGTHEIPVFVRERIELTPGTFDTGEPPVDPRPKHRLTGDAGAG